MKLPPRGYLEKDEEPLQGEAYPLISSKKFQKATLQ
ncbi:hypothetical protein CGBL_0104220 [Corynebacterium glutamicum]|nr:hypothetical protein CGBL_0104220 [Corynebacterium glutamicum]